MKKTFKKITSTALAMLISASIFSIAPISADALPDNFYYYKYEIINENEACITEYNGFLTAIDIPSSIDGYTVTKIGKKLSMIAKHWQA